MSYSEKHRLEVVVVISVIVGVFIMMSMSNDNVRVDRRRRRIEPRYRPVEQKGPLRPIPPQSTPSHSAINAPVLCGRPYVTDGDSLIIQKTEIRLFGVDAPEMNHPYGKQAKWALFALCNGHEVRAECVETDGHGRSVAKCFLPDGRDLSAEMVKLGLAIDWPKFSGGRYRNLEVPDARKKMWLADARQKGRMDVWAKFDANQQRRRANGK